MMSSRGAFAIIVFLVLTVLPVAASSAADTPRDAVKVSLEELGVLSKAVNRAYGPFRRGAPADTSAWSGLQDLYVEVGRVAAGASRLRDQVDTLRDADGFQAAVGAGEFRRRLAVTDSLIIAAVDLAGSSWRTGRPDDGVEARTWATARARAAKQLADRTAAAAGNVSYAVGVTEGVGRRTLNLSMVGIVVVFGVLTLIALVVGTIRRLDDDWQTREQATAIEALEKEPTIDETTVVLIAAACATLITGRHRVRRIRRLLSPKQKRTPWSAQGRLILQGSHTVGRKSN